MDISYLASEDMHPYLIIGGFAAYLIGAWFYTKRGGTRRAQEFMKDFKRTHGPNDLSIYKPQ